MRDYGMVSPQFWIGETGKALRGTPALQVAALYLMTSPHANMIGVYYCPLDYIGKETGLGLQGASEALRSLQKVGFCSFSEQSEEVFVHRMAAYQIGDQLDAKDNRCKGVARELEKVSSSELQQAFRAIYSVAFHLQADTTKKAKKTSPLQAPTKPEAEAEAGTEEKNTYSSPAKLPTCPYDGIVSLYLELLPELPTVRVMDAARMKGINSRWKWVLTTSRPDGTRRAETTEEAMEWFRSYFERAHDNDFLMGRTKRTGDHANWKCDIDFLMTDRGLKQVIERTEVAA